MIQVLGEGDKVLCGLRICNELVLVLSNTAGEQSKYKTKVSFRFWSI